MADGDFTSQGTGTLSASGPGVIASVTVTDASINATDRIHLTETNAVKDIKGEFGIYVSSVSAGSFVVKAKREQLPEDMTFNYIGFATA